MRPESPRPACLVLLLVALSGLLAASETTAQDAEGGDADPPQVVDHLVAVVDEDPIFLSEVDQAAALGLYQELAGLGPTGDRPADRQTLRRQVLNRLIEQRVRSHEVERYELEAVPGAVVARQVDSMEAAAGGSAELDRRLAAHGLTREALEALLRRQLRVLAFVEERLSPRVLIDDDQIRDYYEGELADEMATQDEPLPPLAQVRDGIREVLRQRALNREIERWTRDLRERADIVDLLYRDPLRPLPPVAVTLGSPEAPAEALGDGPGGGGSDR